MTLFRYLLRQLATGVVIAVCGMFFIAIPGVTVSAVHKLGGVGMQPLLEYLPLVLLDLVPYLLPIGFLLAVVSTYGRLAADNEWTAIRMAGVHPMRAVAPALVMALVCSAVLHVLVSNVSPGLSFQKREVLRSAVATSFKALSPGQNELDIGRFYLNAAYREGNTFHEALINIPGEDGATDRTILADAVTITPGERDILIEFVNARTVVGDDDTRIGRPTIRLNLDQLFQTDKRTHYSWKFRPTAEVRAMLAAGQISARETARARFEVQRRYALACTPLLFLILGVPTGLLLRSSTQLAALAAAVGYALAYYLLSMRLGKTLGQEAVLPDWVAAWGTTILGAIGGALLARKAFRQ